MLLETKEYVGLITLNRPEALNPLSLGLIRKIHPQLKVLNGVKAMYRLRISVLRVYSPRAGA